MSQSNIKQGDFVIPAGEDLTGKEDHLVVMNHASGIPEVKLPTHASDYAFYVLLEGAADESNVSIRPLEPGRSFRLKLSGACNPGDSLVLADVSTNPGQVRALPTGTPGTYRVLAVAEQAGVDGQLVLCRGAYVGNVTVV